MFKDQETGFWEDDFRRKGVTRLHLSYGVTRKAEAERLAAGVKRLFDGKHVDLIEQLRAGHLTVNQVADHLDADLPIDALRRTTVDPVVQAWPTVKEAADALSAWQRDNPNRAAKTEEATRSRLKRFCTFLNAHPELVPRGSATPLDEVPTSAVEAYQADMLADDGKINTVRAYVAQIGALYRWQQRREERAAREGKRPPRALHIPIDAETVAKGSSRRERYLNEGEAQRLFEACPDPLRFPLAAGLFAGLRIDEMLHLRPAFDVDLVHGLLIVQPQPTWTPKTKKRREIPIAPPLRPLLERHLDRYASEDWLVPSPVRSSEPCTPDALRKRLKIVVIDAELAYGRGSKKGVVYHTLRHTFASWLIMRGVDLYTVAQLLGNSLAMVEKVYSHLAPDFRQRALDRLAGAISLTDSETLNEDCSATTEAT